MLEKIVPASDPSISQIDKIRISSVVQYAKTTLSGGGTTGEFYYLHRDHLGSVDVITSGSGSVLERLAFDPFGGRREADWSSDITPPSLDPILANCDKITCRGFTDHEHLDRTGIVHMNGRIYDPVIGRFLSADPIVQAPLYSQSYNRYAYTFNSPLSFVDPSGYSSHDDVNPTETLFENFWLEQLGLMRGFGLSLEWAIRLTNFRAERHGN
ncbi:MAG: RHS repeat-associated core domain-containing protein [Pseudomonadales bacterium]|nr:RHS repeat-associated core domain-containing protein [Pseudomonadales bacterium]